MSRVPVAVGRDPLGSRVVFYIESESGTEDSYSSHRRGTNAEEFPREGWSGYSTSSELLFDNFSTSSSSVMDPARARRSESLNRAPQENVMNLAAAGLNAAPVYQVPGPAGFVRPPAAGMRSASLNSPPHIYQVPAAVGLVRPQARVPAHVADERGRAVAARVQNFGPEPAVANEPARDEVGDDGGRRDEANGNEISLMSAASATQGIVDRLYGESRLRRYVRGASDETFAMELAQMENSPFGQESRWKSAAEHWEHEYRKKEEELNEKKEEVRNLQLELQVERKRSDHCLSYICILILFISLAIVGAVCVYVLYVRGDFSAEGRSGGVNGTSVNETFGVRPEAEAFRVAAEKSWGERMAEISNVSKKMVIVLSI